jgi:hypothetical protein
MSSVENDIGEVLAARLMPAPSAKTAANPFEDFAIANMRSLAFGASGALAALAAILSFSGKPAQGTIADPVIVGMIQDAPRVPSAPAWRAIAKPVEMMALQAPQFARHAAEYQARRNDRGDREDRLTFEPGSPDAPQAAILLRRSAASHPQPSLFTDMTRLQAERTVAVTRAAAPGRLATKFGDLEVADMTFQGRDGRGLACLSFRSDAGAQPIALAGWYCAPQGAGVERPEVACFVDRLALLKAGEDKELRAFFAEAEQRRRPCPTMRVSTGRKPTWLDADGKAPAMRGDGWRGDITGSVARR